MSFTSSRDWIVVDSRCVEGLGQGDLMQSAISPVDFQAEIKLNSYESNCLRDWLAQRWRASSLEKTCISLHNDLGLMVTLIFNANNLFDAKERFEAWLSAVLVDRESAIHSRK
ncbi:hypothetical protein [Limnobacter sp.]|uniref:hypothetical protein n=1 Tax=Limnobacter sp. TaxID=2003368 RepID=UPI002FDF83BB